MILTEYLNDGTLVKHYSDAGFMLRQIETGAEYAEPIDLVPCVYTYEETEKYIDGDGNEEVTGDEFLSMVKEVL